MAPSAGHQFPGHPTERDKFVLSQWRPSTESVIFWIALSLLFGGRLAPLGFARFPAWVIETVAALFAFAMQHCVDDVLHIGPLQLAEQAYVIWMQFTKAYGRDLPMSKSPWPSQLFDISGISLGSVAGSLGTRGHGHHGEAHPRPAGQPWASLA
jgi:hypothetical protein